MSPNFNWPHTWRICESHLGYLFGQPPFSLPPSLKSTPSCCILYNITVYIARWNIFLQCVHLVRRLCLIIPSPWWRHTVGHALESLGIWAAFLTSDWHFTVNWVSRARRTWSDWDDCLCARARPRVCSLHARRETKTLPEWLVLLETALIESVWSPLDSFSFLMYVA